jgi:hypothetical protein
MNDHFDSIDKHLYKIRKELGRKDTKMRLAAICKKCKHRDCYHLDYPCNICNPDENKFEEKKDDDNTNSP